MRPLEGSAIRRRPVRFFSGGLGLAGDLYIPEDIAPAERRPAVVSCSGYQGLKDIHPARFARVLVPDGYVCLAFDYRGFGNSEGEPGRIVPQEQVEDARSAVTFLETVPEVDPEQIALLGWALGASVAVAVAADDARVCGVIALNAIGDGERWMRSMHDERSWTELLQDIAEDRRRRAFGEKSELVHPLRIVRIDETTRRYVDKELHKVAGFGGGVTLESADFLLRFRPEIVVDRVSPRPLLLIHGAENRLHVPEESRQLHRRAGEPTELVLLEDRGHTEWMLDDHPTFRYVVDLIRSFLRDSLVRWRMSGQTTTEVKVKEA
ncbi:hypothetical protein BH23ACT11_BH23ACT11_22030 [soil metagenome]